MQSPTRRQEHQSRVPTVQIFTKVENDRDTRTIMREMVLPPTGDAKWWKLQVKGLGSHQVRSLRLNDKLFYELAVGGRVQEIRLVVKPLRTEIHLVVRTVTPDPKAPETPENAVGIDLGIINRVALSNGFRVDGVTEDRAEIKKQQRVLSKRDDRHIKAGLASTLLGVSAKWSHLQKAHARVKARERHSLHRLVHHVISMCVRRRVRGNRRGASPCQEHDEEPEFV